MRNLLSSILLTVAFWSVQATDKAQPSQTHLSPDGALWVKITTVNRRCVESRIEIRKASGLLLLWKSLASTDCEHGMAVEHGAWTPDAKFFVFNAQSTGGHQPWHWPLYFYSRNDNRIRCLDDFVGPIIATDFRLEAPHMVQTRKLLGNFGDDEGGPIVVNLSRIRRTGHR